MAAELVDAAAVVDAAAAAAVADVVEVAAAAAVAAVAWTPEASRMDSLGARTCVP